MLLIPLFVLCRIGVGVGVNDPDPIVPEQNPEQQGANAGGKTHARVCVDNLGMQRRCCALSEAVSEGEVRC
jgi:hypothetical protein